PAPSSTACAACDDTAPITRCDDGAMRISVSADYWSSGPPPGAPDLFETAELIGIDQIWTAEAYGSDAWTPLAWWGSRTSRIKLGTAVSQLSARPPVTLAMTAMTMDHLTQGRV